MPGSQHPLGLDDGAYNAISGTSMASPHFAGTVALMWSAAPALIGDIAQTRALLDQTAIDTSDLTCGGTAANNNVFGEGRLDAFAAVDQAPRGLSGDLVGIVTDTNNVPIAGATVHVAGPYDWTTLTNAAGQNSFRLSVGSYNLEASHFGYLTATKNGVDVAEDATTTQNIALTTAPAHTVAGVVRDSSNAPLSNAGSNRRQHPGRRIWQCARHGQPWRRDLDRQGAGGGGEHLLDCQPGRYGGADCCGRRYEPAGDRRRLGCG